MSGSQWDEAAPEYLSAAAEQAYAAAWYQAWPAYPVFVPVAASPPQPPPGQGSRRARKGRGKGQPAPRAIDSMSSVHDRFREEVLQLRRARTASAAVPCAKRLRSALLAAEAADATLDGPLMGMAAANSARLRMPDLLEAICAYAACRLETFGGREVAEMAVAAQKMERLGGGFARAVGAYCAAAPRGAFRSVRDVAMAATVLFQNLRSAGASFHGAALKGLAETAMPLLREGEELTLRDAVELAHALAHACEATPTVEGVPLHRHVSVEAALEVALVKVWQGLPGGSAFDVAMGAGAGAAVWALLPQQRESTLRPLLLDAAGAARRQDFSMRDLALLAGAFAKAGIASADLAAALNSRTQQCMQEMSNRDICYFLWAASEVPTWCNEAFAAASVMEVEHRDLSSFNARDLSTLASSLSRLGSLGRLSLESLLDEAFRRQLLGFLPKDRAALLGVLARLGSPPVHNPLLRLLIRSLAGEHPDLDAPAQCQVLQALSALWPSLPPEDAPSKLLANALCAAEPWHKVSGKQLASVAEALSKLPKKPGQAWASLLSAVEAQQQEDAMAPPELATLLLALNSAEATGSEALQRHLCEGLATRLMATGLSQQTLHSLREGLLGKEVPSKMRELLGQHEPVPEPAPEEPAFDMPPIRPVAGQRAGKHTAAIVVPSPDFCSDFSRRCEHEDDKVDGSVEGCRDCHPVKGCEAADGTVRLNQNCDFPGHCLQLKHTFLHIPCGHDSDEDEDCVVCRLTRARSSSF